jgi:MoxR-like ATPase
MSDVAAIQELVQKQKALKQEIAKVIVGQDEVVHQIVLSIFSGGHALLVGVPGLAKTLMVNTIAQALGLDFKRIQFTPDLMPSDIIGTELLDQERNFQFSRGPIFSNIILADEINRTPPKTQSALLEAMQEETVSVAGTSYELPKPFFVLATQNPIEQEGTYPLPEAQLDRFLFMIQLDYPSFSEEVQVVRMTEKSQLLESQAPIVSAKTLLEYQDLVKRVPVSDLVVETAVRWVQQTRISSDNASPIAKEYITWGAGPRASQNLILAAKCHALMHGRYSPNVEDVREMAVAVLQHRIIPNYKADSQGLSAADLIRQLVQD